MKKIIIILISILITSCSISKVKQESIRILQFENLENGITRTTKATTIHINHNDTIIEQAYVFFIPQKFKKYESSVGTTPTVHLFTYHKKEKIIVIKNKGLVNKVLENEINVNLNKELFFNEVEKMYLSKEILRYLRFNDIEILENKKFGILKDDNIVYLFLNYKNEDIVNFINDIENNMLLQP